jgi:hypothetical protein
MVICQADCIGNRPISLACNRSVTIDLHYVQMDMLLMASKWTSITGGSHMKSGLAFLLTASDFRCPKSFACQTKRLQTAIETM